MISDKHVEAVKLKTQKRSIQKLLHDRMIAGYQKYGCTTERTDLSLDQWLQHLQEELLDASVYIETINDKLADGAALKLNLLDIQAVVIRAACMLQENKIE